jgi:hypothetical protein
MTVEDLIFVGLNGYAVALNRDTGEIVWSNDQMKSGYVTLLLDFDRLIVSTNGYIYCLDPPDRKHSVAQSAERLRCGCANLARLGAWPNLANRHRASRRSRRSHGLAWGDILTPFRERATTGILPGLPR